MPEKHFKEKTLEVNSSEEKLNFFEEMAKSYSSREDWRAFCLGAYLNECDCMYNVLHVIGHAQYLHNL